MLTTNRLGASKITGFIKVPGWYLVNQVMELIFILVTTPTRAKCQEQILWINIKIVNTQNQAQIRGKNSQAQDNPICLLSSSGKHGNCSLRIDDSAILSNDNDNDGSYLLILLVL